MPTRSKAPARVAVIPELGPGVSVKAIWQDEEENWWPGIVKSVDHEGHKEKHFRILFSDGMYDWVSKDQIQVTPVMSPPKQQLFPATAKDLESPKAATKRTKQSVALSERRATKAATATSKRKKTTSKSTKKAPGLEKEADTG